MKGPFSKTTNIETDTLTFHDAAKNGNLDLLSKLLSEGANIDAKDNNSKTALIHAVLFGHDAIVKHLLDKGADIEAKDSYGQTALIYAALFGYDAIVKHLLDKGADIEAKDSYGQTALINAVMDGRDAIVKHLLDKGADIEAKDNNSKTALFRAVMNGRDAIVKHLLDKGADTEAKDSYGQTALIYAAIVGRHVAIVKHLLDEGADIEAKDSYGQTALIHATIADRDAMVKHLLDNGADIEAKDSYGQTASYYVKSRSSKISEFLRQESERRLPILIILDKLFVNTLNLLNESLTPIQQESQADSNDNVLSNEKGQFLSSELKEPPKDTEEELKEFLTIENGRFELKESPKKTASLTDEEAQFFLDLKNQKIIKKSLTKLLSIDDVKFDPVDGVSSVEYKTKKSSTKSETNSVPSLKVLAFKTMFENSFEVIKEELRVRLETDTTPEKESESLKKATTTPEKGPKTPETTPSSSTTPQSAIVAKGSNNSKSNQKT